MKLKIGQKEKTACASRAHRASSHGLRISELGKSLSIFFMNVENSVFKLKISTGKFTHKYTNKLKSSFVSKKSQNLDSAWRIMQET